MREIVLDTETTGFEFANGDRLVEIGCVELMNHVPTGRTYQVYVNPEREMSEGALGVTGLTNEFLADKPLFADIVEDFLDFIGDAPFVIHNAAFDIGFLNMELARIGREGFPMERATDTVLIARRKFPGAPASLDALCKRFDVDLSKRGKHGALLDCELLAAVYLELIGGRQQGFSLARATGTRAEARLREVRPPRPHAPSDEELAAHAAMIAEIKGALWTAE
ncbi:DNA polymerase III subunit epsilon [Zavarzinia aquatilis]|uniref:DNA polymerase III subunit epsilon n=1 Tax=Zavarzinia aquatilis TaxID=2211142 RepID=A0A317E8A5_9PROT|nr:DNA polymerase III subunit epsilon [Zavarzinia aquatilis]PWR22486.1 DNA polymerase III subunit epsilon [Zavarzinia aquatilis]